VVTGEVGSSDVAPDRQANVQHEAGVLGAETDVRKCVETRIAAAGILLCDSLEDQEQRAANRGMHGTMVLICVQKKV
jgi:hypothetical protein